MNKPDQVSLLALTCSEASRLQSAALDRELTRRERWALWLHTRLCSACRRFGAHLRSLQEAINAMPANWRKEWRDQAVRLSTQRRETIKRLLVEARESES